VEGKIEVSIVMPCLNEARTLGTCIRKAQAAIREHDLHAEVIVADNGSTDGSQKIAEELGARVIDVPERGYGAALLAGIQAAHGTYVIMADADDSYDFGAIYPFVERLRGGDDLVMGCRLPSGGGTIMPGAMPWKHRWIGNPILSAIGRLLFHSPVTDFHCGLRGFRRDAILQLNVRTAGMEFASEMVIKATISGAKMSEIPITLYKDGRDRRPHLRSWRDGWRHLRFMLLFSPRWLFLLPGILLFLAGFAGGAFLVRGPVHIGHVGFDTNSLLVCAMMLMLGFQIIVYAVFARIFAITEGLLKVDRLTERGLRIFTLEGGITIGALTTIGGIVLIGYVTYMWIAHGMGALDAEASRRLMIPGITGVILGVQIVFASFFLSILGLSRR